MRKILLQRLHLQHRRNTSRVSSNTFWHNKRVRCFSRFNKFNAIAFPCLDDVIAPPEMVEEEILEEILRGREF